MPTRDEYIDTVKSGLVLVGTNSVMAALSAIPGIGPIISFPVVSTLVKIFVNKVISLMVNSVEMEAFFLFVDMRTSEQGRKWIDAAKANREAHLGSDKDAIARAEKSFMDAHRDLVRLSS